MTIWDDLRLAVALLTRLPFGVPRSAADPGSHGRALWAYPLVGALIGALGGGVMAAAMAFGTPSLVAALLGVAVTVLVTGCLHEDGLADFCDGLGGATRERRLEIMRDSRLGTYGGVALVLSVALRAAALAGLAGDAALIAIWTVASALGRGAIALILMSLSPARSDGLGVTARRPPTGAVAGALIIAGGLAYALLSTRGLWLALAAGAAGLLTAAIARRMLRGYTGDVLGASAQLAEIAALVTASALWRPA